MKTNKKMIEDFMNDYKSGLSTIKIGKKYNVSYTTVYNYLKNNNIKIRSASQRARKYAINETFFNIIDMQEKAYFLGILYADGCNSTERNSITLALKKDDNDILKKLSALVYQNNDRPLECRPGRIVKLNGRNYKSNGLYALTMASKTISERLNELGVVKAKTHKITFPTFLSHELISHFVRGYFDGDGSVSLKKSGQTILSIIGTRKFCKSLQDIINKKLNLNPTVCHAKKGSKVQQFALHGNIVCLKFLNWMYKDATIYLDRKYNKYIEIKNTIPIRYGNCKICNNKHYGKGYCKYHHYEYIGRKERRERYLKSKK